MKLVNCDVPVTDDLITFNMGIMSEQNWLTSKYFSCCHYCSLITTLEAVFLVKGLKRPLKHFSRTLYFMGEIICYCSVYKLAYFKIESLYNVLNTILRVKHGVNVPSISAWHVKAQKLVMTLPSITVIFYCNENCS